jgi:biotin-dependent carboxylase-like uncharacterized protein
MARCTVIDAGFYTTVQDLGRLTAREHGVPHSGAMDQQSAAQANGLLGNDVSTAVLEMTMTGATLLFSEPTYIAITGATSSVFQNHSNTTSPCVLAIKTGDVIKIGVMEDGNFSYLAVAGGFHVERYLDSASYYPILLDTAFVEKGSFFTFEPTAKKTATLQPIKNTFAGSIKAYPGPEFHLLTKKQQEQLLLQSFTISRDWNRMAYQLEELVENDLAAIESSPVLPGTVQLTPQGKLIILMRDAQTTGGYPRVLQLTSESLSRLSQRRVGTTVDFVIVSL